MMQLTRRNLFAGAAAATAATALTPLAARSPAFAAVPPAGKQALGVYRHKLGDFELTQITDGAARRPVSNGFVVNISKDQAIAETEAVYFQKDQVVVPFNPLLINTGSKLVLIDTGAGPSLYEKSKGAVGQLHTNMAAAGIDRNAIDIVILSHFHGDHINGLRWPTADWRSRTRNSRCPAWNGLLDERSQRRESDWLQQKRLGVPKGIFAGLENKVTKYEAGKEVAPGITSIATPAIRRTHLVRRCVRFGARLVQSTSPISRSSSCAIRIGTSNTTSIRPRRADPPQVLRHGIGGKVDGDRLPLPVPVCRLCREGRHRLPAGADRLEPVDLSALTIVSSKAARKAAFIFHAAGEEAGAWIG